MDDNRAGLTCLKGPGLESAVRPTAHGPQNEAKLQGLHELKSVDVQGTAGQMPTLVVDNPSLDNYPGNVIDLRSTWMIEIWQKFNKPFKTSSHHILHQ